MRNLTCIQLQNTYKKGTAYFSTNQKKTGNNFNSFFHDFFSAFIDKLSERRILQFNNTGQNDFISDKSTQLK